MCTIIEKFAVAASPRASLGSHSVKAAAKVTTVVVGPAAGSPLTETLVDSGVDGTAWGHVPSELGPIATVTVPGLSSDEETFIGPQMRPLPPGSTPLLEPLPSSRSYGAVLPTMFQFSVVVELYGT